MAAGHKLELRKVDKFFDDFQAVESVFGGGPRGRMLGPARPQRVREDHHPAHDRRFLHPDGGDILIDGSLVAGGSTFVPPHMRGIGMVFQSYAVWPHMTVYENVAYGLKIRKVPRAEQKKRVKEALHLVHLDGLAERYPSTLSGGQQQRVSLARAPCHRAHNPSPRRTAQQLDAKLSEQMRFDLKNLQAQLGLTAVYVTHDQAEAMVLANRIVVMEQSRVVQIGTPEEVYGRPRTCLRREFHGPKQPCCPGRSSLSVAILESSLCTSTESVTSVCRMTPPTNRRCPGRRGFYAYGPEFVRLSRRKRGEADEGWLGSVTTRTYLGADVDYRVRVGAIEDLRVSLHPSNSFSLMIRVSVSVNPGDCSWLVA